jgi:hypothetical protein
MASIVQICNVALSRIGQSQRINALDEGSLASELCDLHYPLCVQQVLADGDWPFAEARVVLADIGTPPTNWEYRYAYPSDCLKARRIAVPGMEIVPLKQRIPFKVINAVTGKAIVANWPEAELVYTADVTDTSLFPALFVSALAWRLAAELAIGLQARAENFSAAMGNYEREISKAQAVAYEEGEEGEMPDSEFIRARG